MTFHQRLISELTQLDNRESMRKHHNPYALSHYFKAAEGVTDAKSFADAFIPTRGMHRVAKNLGLGLDVEKGRWIFT